MTDIFQFEDYKSYLNHLLNQMPGKGWGVRGKLAEHINLQKSYISRVLTGPADFNLEQAILISQFFHHSETEKEKEYFLLLVQFARAGNLPLKEHLKKQLKQLLEARSHLAKRLNTKNTINKKYHDIYYSAWYYSAVHVLLSIPQYQTRPSIEQYLKLPPELVYRVLEFLVEAGMASFQNGKYTVSKTQIHLSSDSYLILKHHSNWRQLAMRSIDLQDSDDLHYSSVAAVSKSDALKLKELLVQMIQHSKNIIRDSKEETMVSICLDLFKV